MLPKAEFIRELTEEQAKVYLYNVLESGMGYRDFLILREVIKCESGWRHFGKDGEVVISSGNIGYGQINRLVWYDFFNFLRR